MAKIDSEGRTPQFLEKRYAPEGEPLWVRAEDATRPDGTVDWDLLGERAKDGFDSVARQTPMSYRIFDHHHSGVVEMPEPDGTMTTWHHWGPSGVESPLGGRWKSLGELVEKADAIYLGTVIGFAEGFFGGGPATLLTIRLDEVLRGYGGDEPNSEVYLYYPDAKFSIGDLNFWTSHPSYPERPALGDLILLADDRPSPDRLGRTFLPRLDGLFVESRRDNRLTLKGRFSSTLGEFSRLEDVVAHIRSLLSGESVQ